jgi:hypothetical protein
LAKFRTSGISGSHFIQKNSKTKKKVGQNFRFTLFFEVIMYACDLFYSLLCF